MDLPKIKNENLPQELREILGDADAEFDAIVDPSDIVSVPDNRETYEQDRIKTARMLIDSRNKLEDYRNLEKGLTDEKVSDIINKYS